MAKNDLPQRSEQSQKDDQSDKTDLVIDLLGTSFSITAEEEKSYLEGILNNYRLAVRNIQESSGLRDPLKLAILTGFLLCDKIQRIYLKDLEVKELSAQDAEKAKEAEQIALDLIARIDKVLEADK